MELLACIVVACLAAVPVALVLARRRPDWARSRVAMVAAAPLPGVALLFCAWIFADAVITPAARCGTDACAMAMAAAVMLCLFSGCGYGVAVMIAGAVLERTGRR